MLKTSFDENGKMVVNADADIFIIPNKGCKLDDYFESFREDLKKYYEDLCEANNTMFFENDKLVQVWITSKDLETDNLFCHAAWIDNYVIRLDHHEDVPMKLIHIKEGESTTLVFNGCATNLNDNTDKKEVKLVLNVTANQLGYRYRNSGKFEDIMAKVCA